MVTKRVLLILNLMGLLPSLPSPGILRSDVDSATSIPVNKKVNIKERNKKIKENKSWPLLRKKISDIEASMSEAILLTTTDTDSEWTQEGKYFSSSQIRRESVRHGGARSRTSREN
ncbi:hypothetical protein P5V15_015624 [Pogonomyrmex californicus]